jgi:hypothetical protein
MDGRDMQPPELLMPPRLLGVRALLLLLVVVAASPGNLQPRLATTEIPTEALLDDAQRLAIQMNAMDHAALLGNKRAAVANAIPLAIAGTNGALATEAQVRAAVNMKLWLTRLDRVTGLPPTSFDPYIPQFVFGDAGADFFPHFGIAVHLLSSDDAGLIRNMLSNERRLTSGIPETIDFGRPREIAMDQDAAIFDAAEYVKDGLLPLIERLGPDPWLGRASEIADAIIAAANVPTPKRGNVPANSTEVNGDMLQLLARLYWATRDNRYLEAADRIALTYIEDVLPKTTYLPPNQWNFIENEPIGRRRLRLSDHGNEVISGLIEWHLIESALQRPGVEGHRQTIRRMLDRILQTGRNEDGMWLRVIEIPSGRVEQPGVTDNWGYVFQAFMAHAEVERRFPNGDLAAADRYDEAARRAIQSLPNYHNYSWQSGEMDGYADALESVFYMLDRFPEQRASDWTDEEMGALYKYQKPDGKVLERDLDGNFMRTSLLYASWLMRGARLTPWSPNVDLGAAVDGDCVIFALQANADWLGRIVLDTPRSRENFKLPFDYPRLNKWPEWFVAEPNHDYHLTGSLGERLVKGEELSVGLQVKLTAGQDSWLRVCPA